MTAAVHLGDVVPGLVAPEPTEQKLGRKFGQSIDWDKIAETASEPSPTEDVPLDKRRFAQGVEAARAPQWRGGTFRCPLGIRGPAFDSHCRAHVGKWIEEERRRGFDVWSSTRIQIDLGPYPATDLATGLKLLGEREMLVRAQFVEREPDVVRLELPGGLFRPWRPTPLPTSTGDV
jgi:hypothetical protein